ncbi:hypothetical protein [Candidatus Entotheonella palauensis]|uniref:DUF948 domain-containing protein n=1 Tax=Candidatus Entotheonella gemina TaxID=1429439 RepID=W4MAV1_9BACT|nr:hypothetical protein [Candidatus Entotheonella palauensis]ETX07509.1 MAG: hypothetical protein ETSY2_10725 [Candidatus Entotheonella gemina]
MSLLLGLTLLYVVILVLALAFGLIAILYYLNGARTDLARIADGLKDVDRNVEPLSPALTGINEGLITLLGHLKNVQHNLARADSRPDEDRLAS